MLTIYKASAGSGKTYTLTYEYIKLVLGYKDDVTGEYRLKLNPQDAHHAILAITFTNKATDEMKRRIIKELAILAEVPSVGNEKSPYANSLIALYGCTRDQLKESAQKVLSQLLFDYTFFNISTIDAFFQNVLRTFALEAELDGNYDVEIDDKYAVSIGLNEVFNKLNNKDDDEAKLLAEWIKHFMMQKINEGSGFNIFNRKSHLFNELLSFIKELCGEQFKQYSSQLLEYLNDHSRIITFEKELKKQISILKNTIISQAKDVFSSLNDSEIDGLRTHVRNPLLKWTTGNIFNPSDTILNVASRQLSAFPDKYTKKNPVSEDIEELIANAINSILEISYKLNTLKLLSNNLYGLGMIGDTLKFINKFRNENNLILLSDTNELLQKIINEEEAPFIYERLGVSLRHFLIDEFQDTSQLQWQNLSPLVSESLSHNNDNLIIGDEKQCIYRFRNSDPSLIREKVATDFVSHVKERGTLITDNTNWRSSAEIIKFNNTLFSAIAHNYGLTKEYANVIQQVSPKHRDHHGYIKFTRIKNDLAKAEQYTKSFEIMASDIKRQLEAGYEPRDIAILVREKNDGQRAIDYLLQQMANPDSGFPQINIISDDTLQIGSSPMVRLILSVLRLINADIPATDSKHISKRKYNQILNRYEYYLNNGKAPHEALDAALNISLPKIDELIDEVANIKYTNLPSIVERIISRYIPENKRKIENAFITAFQDEVLDFCSHGSCDLNSFLKWWNNPTTKHVVTSSTDVNAIRVMTIHKSKGLEFKCVHIPIGSWALAKDSRFGWYQSPHIEGIDPMLIPPIFALKNEKKLLDTPFESKYQSILNEALLDTINVTYVAFTRAINELCVTCISPTRNGENNIDAAVYNSFNTANSEFCNNLTSQYPNIDQELFIPLNNYDSEETLIIGNPTTPQKEFNVKEISPSEKVEIKEASPYITEDRDDIWNLTRLEDYTPIDEARERGIFLHNVLSNVNRIEDLPISINRWGYKARLDKESIDNAFEFLNKAISSPKVIQWFDGFKRALTERSIIVKETNSTFRPDRVVWTANNTVDVIDYKFGEEHKAQYEKQIKNYMYLLSEMGNENVRGFIWYLDKDKIIEVK